MGNQEEWLYTFYKGTFLVRGWEDRMTEILKGIGPDEKDSIKNLLECLGDKIGREWSKDNGIRRINTPMLKQWGEALQRAKKGGSALLNEEIHKIDKEVEKILSYD